MQAIEKVTPRDVDGIQFYISNDGTQCGISVRGLTRLCGISDGGGLSRQLEQLQVRTWKGSKTLDHLQGKVFSCGLEGDDGARLVTSEAAASIIEYYAYDSKATNDTAKNSFRKFAKLGIDAWIKQVTGYSNGLDNKTARLMNAEVLAAMQMLIAEVQEAKAIAREYNEIRSVTINVYPGLDSMLDQLPGINALPASKDLVTAREWLATKGITLNHGKMCAFGRLVADTFKSMTSSYPPQKLAKNGNKWQSIGRGYTTEHYPILETAWKQFSH